MVVLIIIDLAFLTSRLSATALIGLLFGFKLVIVIFDLSLTIFPLHLLGLYGLIGVKAKTWAPTGITGPLRDKL